MSVSTRRRRSGILGLALVVCGLVAGVAPAQAAPVAAPKMKEQVAVEVPGVSPVAPDKGFLAEHSTPRWQKGRTITLAPGSVRMRAGADGDVPTCTPYISLQSVPDAVGYVRVDFIGEIVCNFYLAGAGQAYLLDRTAGTQYNNGVLATGNQFYFNPGYYAYSYGSIIVDGRLYDGARQLEIEFDLGLQTLNGVPWAGCFQLPPGVRYLNPCDGVGTPTLQVWLGSGIFNSGLAPYNPAATIRDSPGIQLLNSHISGIPDAASTARQNILDAAAGLPARTSTFGDVGATNVNLGQDMLRGMVNLHLVNGFTFEVSAIAGSNHMNPLSRHYIGKAFDVDRLVGVAVSPSNPNNAAFMAACRAYGATEVLGPGDPGHNGHIHCAWPR